MDSFTLNKIEWDAIRRILAEFCSCSLGKDLTLRISPSRNPQVINKWLSQVTQMESAIRSTGLPPFGGVVNIADALGRARPGGGATGDDYAMIAGTLEGAANIKKYFANVGKPSDDRIPDTGHRPVIHGDDRYPVSGLPVSGDFALLHELAAGIGDFQSEIDAIWSIIEKDGRVMDSASLRLAEIRRQIQQTAQHIHDVIYGYLRNPEVAKLLQNVNVTLHGDRYVLPVRQENRGRLSGVVHRESNSGSTVFVEPAQCVELNNLLSDLYEDERNEVRRLLNHLAIRVSARVEEIGATLRMLAQVDMISAKAQYSYQFDMTCPEIVERGPLIFNQARHPLLIAQAEQTKTGRPDTVYRPRQRGDDRYPVSGPAVSGEVVPIDVRLGQDFDLLMVTGSNTGGKTVSLKTVATLVLMAQSGLHIPAGRGATLPVFHDVFIDIGDEQSLEQSLSTFGGHIKRIKYILSKADRNSLVLLDELGSGTDPDEGGAIGQAILDELRHVGCLGMITTHLSVLKAYAFSNSRIDNASVEFDTATLSPTYHLIIGRPGESHAITVAQKLGMPKRIIGSARQHLSAQGKQFTKAIAATNAVRESAEAARAEAQAAQLEARSQQEVYQSKLADLHRLQDEFETWLARLPELKTGDELFVPSLGRRGKLVRLELHRQIALVDSENMQVEVPLSDLMPDLGQAAVRQEIAALRKQILDQARLAEETRAQAARVQEEYHRSLNQQKERARQFDTWLGAIARLKAGDEVPISRKPGRAKLIKVDLPGLRVTVQLEDGEIDLPLQEIFPQTGPFAQHRTDTGYRRPDTGHRLSRREDDRYPVSGQPVIEPDKPMQRRAPGSKAVRASHDALLSLKPGQHVFVVPFNKQATLIRLNAEKGYAIVQSGIFEMQLPLSDLEPLTPI